MLDSPDDEEIERIVFEVPQERWAPPVLDSLEQRLFNQPHRELIKTDTLIGDVRGDSDDASLFTQEVERQRGIPISIEEWRQASTIQEVIDLFRRYRDRSID